MVLTGCVDVTFKIDISGRSTTCTELAILYPYLCFTWSGGLEYCCAACHSAGLFIPK